MAKPLSVEEVTAAADTFFPLFEVVQSRLPEGTGIQDALKVMEQVAMLAQKLRVQKQDERFGFLKEEE